MNRRAALTTQQVDELLDLRPGESADNPEFGQYAGIVGALSAVPEPKLDPRRAAEMRADIVLAAQRQVRLTDRPTAGRRRGWLISTLAVVFAAIAFTGYGFANDAPQQPRSPKPPQVGPVVPTGLPVDGSAGGGISVTGGVSAGAGSTGGGVTAGATAGGGAGATAGTDGGGGGAKATAGAGGDATVDVTVPAAPPTPAPKPSKSCHDGLLDWLLC
jgi:hypothetical protein